jgi:2-oxoglutarate/2-oxoacid ferredoxin oxidoreductase subunit beta
MAMQTVMKYKGLVTGLIYQNKEQKSYQELLHGYSETPLTEADLQLSKEKFDELISEFM